MRSFIPLLLTVLALAACHGGPHDGSGGPPHNARYLGIGTYPAGPLWSHQASVPAPASPSAATLADDEQIIVVVDSQTGEIRQCGNLSGHCIAANPWSGNTAAASLSVHAAELDNQAAEAANSAAPAPSRGAQPHR